MGKRLTQEEVIARFQAKYGDKYDYTKFEYKGMRISSAIICPNGHKFLKSPENHLRGQECPFCRDKTPYNKKTQDTFVSEIRDIWGDLYDLSRLQYVDWQTKVIIGCKKHGWQKVAANKLRRGHGCPKCGIEARNATKVKSKEEFVKQANAVHQGYYNYEDSEYNGCYEPILIGCPKGHSFWQTPTKHLSGHGCTICNASHGEALIRQWLISHNVDFNEQYRLKPIQVLFGRNTFIVDFLILSMNTIIEFHGTQHYSKNNFFHKDEDAFMMQVDRDRRLREYCKLNDIHLVEIPYTEIDNIDKILSKEIGRR